MKMNQDDWAALCQDIEFVDLTAELPALDASKERTRSPTRRIQHRLGLEDGGGRITFPDWQELHDGLEVADAFTNHPQLGRRFPYTFLTWGDTEDRPARIEQLVPLRYRTPHARRYNGASVGCAAMGDFQAHALPDSHLAVLVALQAALARVYPGSRYVGHTDLPGASSDPTKHCPGDRFQWGQVHHLISELLSQPDASPALPFVF